MRTCATPDERLFDFVDGIEETLDEHVAGCDECQAFLAELWSGELARDLTEPVMRQIRMELFLIDAAKLGFGIAARMARGAMYYSASGNGEATGPDSDPSDL